MPAALFMTGPNTSTSSVYCLLFQYYAGCGQLKCEGHVFAYIIHVPSVAHLHFAGLGPPTLKIMAGAALRQYLLDCCKAIKDVVVQHDHLLKQASKCSLYSHLVYGMCASSTLNCTSTQSDWVSRPSQAVLLAMLRHTCCLSKKAYQY